MQTLIIYFGWNRFSVPYTCVTFGSELSFTFAPVAYKVWHAQELKTAIIFAYINSFELPFACPQ